ncbi:MAG TPA: hypothetical protein PK432_02860 [Candidatus Dojkabacteria bacterium]|jgi:hypothetical protein|nr:hypothetical protein [Candidatus Dojkabacteria bacterium]HOK59898.1 hypothetical protein [Candidatus Dojkabacteria bacterium]HQA87923.1 hypothetical protein [Candidatus Dojkabacteria bacterium]
MREKYKEEIKIMPGVVKVLVALVILIAISLLVRKIFVTKKESLEFVDGTLEGVSFLILTLFLLLVLIIVFC